MSKFRANSLRSGFADVNSLNSNFSELENQSDNWLSRNGQTPNEMLANLDMGNNDIINAGIVYADDLIVGTGVQTVSESIQDAQDWAVKTDGLVDDTDYSSKEYAIGVLVPEGSSKQWASVSEGYSDTAAISEAQSGMYASEAQASAVQAGQYSNLGLGAGGVYDLGYVTDITEIFPTDFGTIV